MGQQDDKPTFEFSPFTFSHGFDFLGDMFPVHLAEAVSTNQFGIAQGLGVGVLLVEKG